MQTIRCRPVKTLASATLMVSVSHSSAKRRRRFCPFLSPFRNFIMRPNESPAALLGCARRFGAATFDVRDVEVLIGKERRRGYRKRSRRRTNIPMNYSFNPFNDHSIDEFSISACGTLEVKAPERSSTNGNCAPYQLSSAWKPTVAYRSLPPQLRLVQYQNLQGSLRCERGFGLLIARDRSGIAPSAILSPPVLYLKELRGVKV